MVRFLFILFSSVLTAALAFSENASSDINSSKGNLIEVGKGYAGTSVNSAVFRQNSIVSNDSLQYISFYDKDGNLILGKRFLGESEWELKKTPYKGNVRDAHNIISIGLDGDGFLHVAFDHHGDSLHYTKTVMPGSLQLDSLLPMTDINETDVTYPEFHTLPDGDLLFVFRSGVSGNGNMVINRYVTKEKRWHQVQQNLIDGEGKRNAYWQMHIDNEGVIHLSWVWRESWLVETNHDMNYARSKDGGVTWERSDGTPYPLPINLENAEVIWKIPQNSELINQTSMTTDSHGNPYIATYWRDEESDIPQYRLIWHDGKEWKMSRIGQRSLPFSLSGGGTKMIPVSRPRVVSDGKKAFYIFRDAERNSVVSIASTNDINEGVWEVADVTDFPVDAWEPSIDTELWNREHKLNIYVQRTHQGDSETISENPETETMVFVLEY